tara:strand:- start:205 stop:738 length:534 start_codon:yes stop_codon:yes gene_type:complete
MATTESIVTAVDDSLWNGFLVDDGTISRVREGQVAICTAFGGLAVPAGATVNGIQIDFEGYATDATFTNPFFAVSNDGGTTFSSFRNNDTAPFSTNSGAYGNDRSGGPAELWGMSWTSATANAVQFKIDFNQNAGAVYFDKVVATIYYTPTTTYPSDDNIHIQNGVIVLGNGRLHIK